MKAESLILTCNAHLRYADALSIGLDKHWHEMPYRIIRDTDRSVESSLPDDVRDVVRRVPYLIKIFDFPTISDADTLYVFDSDILIFKHPEDFGERSYQCVPDYYDDEWALKIWKELGHTFERTSPRFVGGMFSCSPKMFLDNRELAIEYIRLCVRYGRDKVQYPGVTMEQGCIAGLWRMTYPDNPLDPIRYPINEPKGGMVMWHISSHKKSPLAKRLVNECLGDSV